MKLYWRFANEAVRIAGAVPPVKLNLNYGIQSLDSPFCTKDYIARWRAIEGGAKVQPADCPPIRTISRYGFCVVSPGVVILERSEEFCRERILNSEFAIFGLCKVSGASWPGTDSNFIASWIAGSEYAKIHTGIEVLFPAGVLLYQGPIPNGILVEKIVPDVMAGLEFFNKKRSIQIDEELFGVAEMNIIVRLPQIGQRTEIPCGNPLAWFFGLDRNLECDQII